MGKHVIWGLIAVFIALLSHTMAAHAQTFTLSDIKSYPFPSGLTAAARGARLAWAFDEQGRRNINVAEGPAFTPRQLTRYTRDDGQELTSIAVSADGQWVVYVRGGEHGAIWNESDPVNPAGDSIPQAVQVWRVPFSGGEPMALGAGDRPVLSPDGRQVAFLQQGQVWAAPLDGSAPARPLFYTRGEVSEVVWSPDGTRLAFVSDRGDHSFIGVFTDAGTPIQWVAPSFHRDLSPRWSPDGSQLAFVRTQAKGGAPETYLERHHKPWAILVADAATGEARQVWKAPETLAGSEPNTPGGFNLHWAAKGRLVFVSYQDGWPHLYSMPAAGGAPLLLTPGKYAVEHISLSPDGEWLVFSANTGPEEADIDRRHLVRVPVNKAEPEVLTPGTGIEGYPVVTGDGAAVALLSATARRPPLPAILPLEKKAKLKVLAEDHIPKQFPQHQLVTPKQIIYHAPDGQPIHAQLFEQAGGAAKKPAIVFVHGGPSRQMLLGWHLSDYYANTYALNQYLASLGFVVLSVNYRLGTGYGYAFHQPDKAGLMGAAEYQDIRAAGQWLAAQPNIDASRIGIYGGSYGGYLTALALARDSDLFAAGVDIHGMSDRSTGRMQHLLAPDRYERAPDAEEAARVIWESSPASAVSTWTSPVLLIHADDDRNVSFSNSLDLVRRLEAQGVPYETLVVVDDTHHWMKYSNGLRVSQATADFFRRKLLKQEKK